MFLILNLRCVTSQGPVVVLDQQFLLLVTKYMQFRISCWAYGLRGFHRYTHTSNKINILDPSLYLLARTCGLNWVAKWFSWVDSLASSSVPSSSRTTMAEPERITKKELPPQLHTEKMFPILGDAEGNDQPSLTHVPFGNGQYETNTYTTFGLNPGFRKIQLIMHSRSFNPGPEFQPWPS